MTPDPRDQTTALDLIERDQNNRCRTARPSSDSIHPFRFRQALDPNPSASKGGVSPTCPKHWLARCFVA